MDSQQLGHSAARISIADVHEVVLGRAQHRSICRRKAGADRQLYVGMPDLWMSTNHARLARAHGHWVLEDSGSKNGTRVNGVLATQTRLTDGDVIETGGTYFLFDASPRRADEPRLIDTAELLVEPTAMVTLNLPLARQLAGLRRVAPSSVPVIICGESGTGKELTVRALHELSGRREKLVAINCGAIPAPLIHAELFGCKRGAYSGATDDRVGLIRSADGGTLFLDEVAELPEASQATLLRFLQEGEVRPVGSADVHRVDVRVVAATHQDLAERVRDGRFRRDLYARLSGYRVDLPPLRDRREDLGTLTRAVVGELAPDRAERVCLRPSAARALFAYDFPLNIRELRHALQAALALTDDGVIGCEHLPRAIAGACESSANALSAKDRALRTTVAGLLRTHGGNVSAVAREMDKAPVQIRRWCKRFDIDLSALRRRST